MSTLAPAWKRLFPIACSLIDQANSGQRIIDAWALGGGTAMMVQLDHRESPDADAIIAALKPRKDRVTNALAAIGRLNPDFVRNAIANLAVKAPFQAVAEKALLRARDVLKAV